jgi:hypothetical protein
MNRPQMRTAVYRALLAQDRAKHRAAGAMTAELRTAIHLVDLAMDAAHAHGYHEALAEKARRPVHPQYEAADTQAEQTLVAYLEDLTKGVAET